MGRLSPEPLVIRAGATFQSTTASTIVFWVAFSLYWRYAENLSEENRRAGLSVYLTDPQRDALQLVFWLLYLGMVVLVPLAAVAVGKMTRTPVPVIVGLTVLAVLVVLLALPILEFQNECRAGGSFVFESYC